MKSNKRVLIRNEEEEDRAAVHAVNITAFKSPAEACLVDILRQEASPVVSLVAIENNAVVGHIMFSPVLLSEQPGLKIMGLAPLAVLQRNQRTGTGSALISAGLQRCKEMGWGAVVVLGFPAYYPRFGFVPASRFGLGCEYDVADEAFMAVELQPGYLHGSSGIIHYHAAFKNI